MRNRRKYTLIATTALLLLGLANKAYLSEDVAGEVSYIKGVVEVYRQGKWTDLGLHAKIKPQDTIRTGKKSRLEIVLVDQSIIRLGAKSKIKIKQAHFQKGKQKVFSADFARGRFYSVVSTLVSAASSFNVETTNAVAGVRGTIFRIDANKDKSTLVRVYAGAVAVSNSPVYTRPAHVDLEQRETPVPSLRRQGVHPRSSDRRVVAGPKEVTKKQWEEYVAKAMHQVRVAASGEIGKPTAFDPEADALDEWVSWNRSRDQQAKE